MVDFTVKEVARHIDTTTQYVYQQIPDLIEKGLAYRDEKKKPFIYDKGLEFLRAKRMTGIQVANKGLQSNINEQEENTEKSIKNEFASDKEIQKIVDIYKSLFEEQKQETKYWKEKFEEKDRAYTEITSSLLLPPGKEEEQQQPKRKKWAFWNR